MAGKSLMMWAILTKGTAIRSKLGDYYIECSSTYIILKYNYDTDF